MLEKQLLTIVAVIKKMQLKLKKNNISIEELTRLVENIQEFDNTDNEQMFVELTKKINEFKTLIDDNREELYLTSISYQDKIKELATSLEISLNGIREGLKDFITIENINKIETELTDKIKAIKIEPQKEIEIGKVYTLDPGEEAKVEVKKTKDTYKLDFYIPRGVSGRGMPGKGVASGGTTNQVLAKNSNDDYDTKWVTGGGGGTSDHSELTNLDYASAGHTGFQPAGDYALNSDIPTKTSELTNDSGFITTPYTLPTASTTVLGGVKIDGSTINITDGVISATTGGGGDVTGPTGATADNIAIFNGTTGKIIKDGGVTIANLPNDKVKYDAGDTSAGYVADKIIAGTGISVAEGTGGNENKLVVTNSAPDQTVAITAGTNITSITGTYPNFTINADTQAGTYTDEKAQDAVGGMVDSTLVYTDGTPELKVANPVIPATVGFTITAGTTPKTLTVSDTASVSGTNTGNQVATDFDIKDLTDSTSLRTTWSGKQDALGFTPENVANKKIDLTDNSDTYYPSQKAVKTAVDGKISKTTNVTAINDTGIADGEIAVFNLTNKDIRTSDKTITTTLGADDTTVPTSKAVKDVTDGKQATLVSGTNIKTINSTTLLGSGDLTISEFTDEKAQDAVGTILTDTNTIDFTYTDATPSITADVKDASISLAKMANLAQNTIIGRVTASTGVPEALTATNVRTIINVADGATANTKAAGSDVTTGTDDTKFVTSKALRDALVPAEVVLYNNSTGTTGNITLSETCANFRYIEIFYKEANNAFNSTKVFYVSGMTVDLTATFVNTNQDLYRTHKNITLNGTALNNTYYGRTIYTYSSNAEAIYNSNSITIVRVVGYK